MTAVCKGGLDLRLDSGVRCWTECSPLSLSLHSMEGRQRYFHCTREKAEL